MLHFVIPPVVVALILGVLGLAVVSNRVDGLLTRLGLAMFGRLVTRDSPRRERELARMRTAHVGQTHRRYASRILFVSTALGVAGAIVGVYLVGALFVLVDADTATLPPALARLAGSVAPADVTPLALFGVLVVASATVGATLSVVGYWAHWLYLDQVASARANRIDSTLPRTVAFIYALSRSGMPFPTVLETLAANRVVYGEAANELSIAVRDVNTFGTDIMTALHDTAERTPSSNLEEFTENLSSVLGSGQSLPSFLREQYERYQAEMAAQQQKYLNLLETFAEIYVTVLVAGPLFIVTVLVVIGLVISDTLPLIQVITYLGIPLASIAFIVYIDSITESLRASNWQTGLDTDTDDHGGVAVLDGLDAVADGGVVDEGAGRRTASNYAKLRAHNRLEPLREWIENPWENLRENPLVTLYVSIPVALVWIVLRFDPDTTLVIGMPSFATLQAYRVVDLVDQPLVEALLLSMGMLSLIYELRKRKYREIENATPDLLDRMASVNEAGLTVVASVERVARTDLDRIGTELERAHRDIEWGADVATALRRMADRARAPMLTRSIALVTNAMGASGDISPVLRIAANETEDTRSLRHERRQQMLTYLIVIYVSFFVFLGIIVALTVSFVPAIESASSSPAFAGESNVSTGVFAGLENANTEAYTLLFFHISIVQGFFSGLIAGQLGEGNVTDGLKHATFLVFVTYVVFLLL